jgi:Flp pilus assembly CpaE family ATPase
MCLAVLDAAALVCVVTAPHMAALRATSECLRVLGKLRVPNERVLLVLDRVAGTGIDYEQVVSALGRTPDVILPYTEQFDAQVTRGLPLLAAHPAGSAAIAGMHSLAARVASLSPARR